MDEGGNRPFTFPEKGSFLNDDKDPYVREATMGDPRRGEKLFKQFCSHCHALTEFERQGIGPYLGGIVGHPSGITKGYNYSPAMKNSFLTWDNTTLNSFLWSPSHFMPGTKMQFRGFRKRQDRYDVIAYMQTH